MNKRILQKCCIGASIVFLLLFIVLISSYSMDFFQNINTSISDLTTVTKATVIIDEKEEEITLPYTFTNLPSGTPLTLTASFSLPEQSYFYVESEYTPLTIFYEDSVMYEYGQDTLAFNTYQDPSFSAALIPLQNEETTVTLTFEYVTPTSGSSFTIEPFIAGEQISILNLLFRNMGATFILSILLVFAGIFLILINGIILTFDRSILSYLWLGLTLFLVGLWVLCSSPLISLFIANYTRLYTVGFFAMVAFPIPLLYFGLANIDFHNKKPLFIAALIELAFAILSLILVLCNILILHTVEPIFNLLVLSCIVLFAVCIFIEFKKYNNKMARRFIVPSILFAIFTLLDFIWNSLSFLNITIPFFLFGFMVFILSMGVLSAFYIKDTLILKEQNQMMQVVMDMSNYQTELLNKHGSIMMDAANNLKKQRHDLRHQLTVIRDLANQETNDALHSYLNTIMINIPSEHFFYCDNIAVNAIVSHYTAMCHQSGINFKINITIPIHDNNDGLDADYCAVFGNLLENAIEACSHVPEGKRFITLNSHTRYDTLIITLENSFDGTVDIVNGRFRSRKRDDYGIGLTSIKSIAKKRGGDASFKYEGNTFTSSLYFNL